VYFKEGAIPEASLGDYFLHLAGNTSDESGSMVEWKCGAVGIKPKYLPSACQD